MSPKKRGRKPAKRPRPGNKFADNPLNCRNPPIDVNAVNNQAEICNSRDEHIQNEMHLDGHTPRDPTMNDDNENGPTQGDVSEDDPFCEEDNMRGPNIGRELDQMTRSRKSKLPLVIEPGMMRPNSVMIAAKFATECNIVVRNHVPIFGHWKDYKKDPERIKEFISRVGSKFHTDVTAAPIKKACVAMMKKAVRQQRYKLKKRYFNALPLHQVPKASPVTSMTNDEWDKLVAYWKKEEKMVNCEKNKTNRGKVQFHQTTGSRSYEMHIIDLANKYKEEPPNALELFKECHYSKKKGFAPAVQSLIVEMEEKLNQPVDEGHEADVTDVVSAALRQKTKKNRFLVNVGVRSSAASVNAERELETQLVMEKQTTRELREVVKTQQQQMDEMMKFEESEIARAKQEEAAKKRQDDTDALIKSLMTMISASQATQ